MAGSPHNQFRLDFESAANERHARLVSAVRIAGLEKLLPLARLVFNMAERRNEPLSWSVERLATEFGVSDRTIQTWQRKLADAGLLVIRERRRERGGQQTNTLAIGWDAVTRLAVGRSENSASPRPEVSSPRPEVSSPRPEVSSPRPEVSSPPYRNNPSLDSSTISPTTQPSAAQPSTRAARSRDTSQSGGRVEELLRNELRIGLAAECCEAVRAAGGTAADIEAVVVHVLAHGGATSHAAWGPGAVVAKLRRWRPGEPVDFGWPPASDAWRRHVARAQHAAAVARQVAGRARRPAIEERPTNILADYKRALAQQHEEQR